MKALIDEFLSPEVPPDADFEPAEDAVAWCACQAPALILEVFRRSQDTYGARCRAWVAWRDAGGQVRGHGWHELSVAPGIVVESPAEAQDALHAFAAAHGLRLEPWRS